MQLDPTFPYEPTTRPTYHLPLTPSHNTYTRPKPKPPRHGKINVKKSNENTKKPPKDVSQKPPALMSSTPISYVILISILILFANCFITAGVYYIRDKMRHDKNKEPEDKVEEGLENAKPKEEKKKHRVKRRKTNEFNEEAGMDSISHISSVSRESTLKRKQGSETPSKGTPKVQKSPKVSKTPQNEKTHRRNKSEASVYSEIGKSDTNINAESNKQKSLKRNASVKFNTLSGLPSKSMTKSTSSISSHTSMKSTASKASIKSTSSRSSLKSNASMKRLKKNASCQSLPTEEYGWGITKEMTMPDQTPDVTIEHYIDHDKQQNVANLQKKKCPKVLPDMPLSNGIQSATLPKMRPPPPPRSTSLTAKEIQELEDIHVVYRKKKPPRRDASTDSCDLSNVDPFYGMGGGEAPASTQSLMYGPLVTPTATVRPRSRKIDGPSDYTAGTYNHYQPYEHSYAYKESGSPSPIPVTPPTVPDPVKSFGSYNENRSPRGPLATFGKSSFSSKDDGGTKTSAQSTSKSHSINPNHSTQVNVTAAAHSVISTAAAPAFVGASTSSTNTSPKNLSPKTASSSTDMNVPTVYEQTENTGTIKRKKSTKVKSSGSQSSPSQERVVEKLQSEKPLKSALKQTSAYDRPPKPLVHTIAPSLSISSLDSSSPSLGSTSLDSVISLNSFENRKNTQRKGARVAAPSTKHKNKSDCESK